MSPEALKFVDFQAQPVVPLKHIATWIPFGIMPNVTPALNIKDGRVSKAHKSKLDMPPPNSIEELESALMEIAIDIAAINPDRLVSVVPPTDKYANTLSTDFSLRTTFDSKLIPPKLYPPRE